MKKGEEKQDSVKEGKDRAGGKDSEAPGGKDREGKDSAGTMGLDEGKKSLSVSSRKSI